MVLISESVRLQQMLATYGIQTETPRQVEPIQIWPSSELMEVCSWIGVSKPLNLSGRPRRPIGHLGTSRFYRLDIENIFLCQAYKSALYHTVFLV